MSKETQPFFIVGSGRSGTQMLAKVFSTYPDVDMHHEYLCTHVQPLAVRYYMGLVSLYDACQALRNLHGAAIAYCDRSYWGDASNKLSWLIQPLDQLFPRAKFINIVRDGRKVTSSFFHKLGDECYDDRSTSVLQAYIDNPGDYPAPPPEKKYWWNLPRPGTPEAEQFRHYNQFQRICFHWGEVNRFIIDKFAAFDTSRTFTCRLEDLVRGPSALRNMVHFIGIPYREDFFGMLQRPHNVNIPQDFPLTPVQQSQLMEVAGDVMKLYGYDQSPEYRMTYDDGKNLAHERHL